MIKYAVYYLKNSFNPLQVPENITLEHGQMVLVRTEKGEEAMWECRVCGHLVMGKKAPTVCPVCGYSKSYFEVREANY